MSASSLRARRRAPEQVMLMTSCTCRCRTTVAAAGKLLGTFRRRARAETAGLRGLVHGSAGSNLSRDAAACASRERAVRSRPPLSNVLHTLVEVDVRVAPEPTGSASAAELCLRCAWHELWSVRWR